MATKTKCRVCKAVTTRRGSKPAVFCSVECKASWQRLSKPVSREWLYERYVTMQMGTYEIAKVVKRNPKQVWTWLRDLGIPIRKRTWAIVFDPINHPHHSRAWLWTEYVVKGISCGDIAARCRVTEPAIRHFMKRHGIKRRTISQARKLKKWCLQGEANGMFGVTGDRNPAWKGGCTPARQACYSSPEWRRAATEVKKRDRGMCQRCGQSGVPLEIHHIIGFACVETRTDADNLVSLCVGCHDFVHSRKNTQKEFIGDA